MPGRNSPDCSRLVHPTVNPPTCCSMSRLEQAIARVNTKINANTTAASVCDHSRRISASSTQPMLIAGKQSASTGADVLRSHRARPTQSTWQTLRREWGACSQDSASPVSPGHAVSHPPYAPLEAALHAYRLAFKGRQKRTATVHKNARKAISHDMDCRSTTPTNSAVSMSSSPDSAPSLGLARIRGATSNPTNVAAHGTSEDPTNATKAPKKVRWCHWVSVFEIENMCHNT